MYTHIVCNSHYNWYYYKIIYCYSECFQNIFTASCLHNIFIMIVCNKTKVIIYQVPCTLLTYTVLTCTVLSCTLCFNCQLIQKANNKKCIVTYMVDYSLFFYNDDIDICNITICMHTCPFLCLLVSSMCICVRAG